MFSFIVLVFLFLFPVLITSQHDAITLCPYVPADVRSFYYNRFCLNPTAYNYDTRSTFTIPTFIVSSEFAVTNTYKPLNMRVLHTLPPVTVATLEILDFYSPCNYYNDVNTSCDIDHCQFQAYITIPVKKGVLCVVYKQVIQSVPVFDNNGYFSVVLPTRMFTLTAHPNDIFNDFRPFLNSLPDTVKSRFATFKFTNKVFLYHKYFDNLLYYIVSKEALNVKCSSDNSVHFNINFVTNSSCFFTTTGLIGTICAAAFTHICTVRQQPLPTFSVEFFLLSSTLHKPEPNPFLPHIVNLINATSALPQILPEILAVVKNANHLKMQSQITLQNLASSFSRNILRDNAKIAADPKQYDALIKTFRDHTARMDSDLKAFTAVLRSLGTNTTFLLTNLREISLTFKKLVAQTNLNSSVFNVQVKDFSDLIEIFNSSTSNINVTLNQKPTLQLIEKFWRSYFYILTKDSAFLEEDVNNVGSIFGWLGNILISVFRPFFDLLIEFIAAILMAIIDFLLDFEPYIAKLLTTLETSLEKLIDIIFKLLTLFLSLINKLFYFIDTRFHLLEFCLLYFFIYFYFSDNHFIVSSVVFVIFCFVGTSRYFPSLLPAFDNFFTHFQHFMHHNFSADYSIYLINSTYYFNTTGYNLTFEFLNSSFIPYHFIDELLDYSNNFSFLV